MNPEGKNNSEGNSGCEMNEQEKEANKFLAQWIYEKYHPKTVMDIGCGYPYLAQCFSNYGCKAIGVDGAFKDGLISTKGLNVETAPYDWENDEIPHKNLDLITSIHVIEHFYNPIEAMRKCYNVLDDEGIIYIRAPNKDVSGIERDHTPGHVAIHPSIFGNESLEFLMAKVGFYLIWKEDAPGYGQTSWIFRKRPAKIGLFMIVKDEEKNIGKCLDSVRDFCDEMVVLDTGSTDQTTTIAVQFGADVKFTRHHNKPFHFSRARNEAMSYLSKSCDWLFWMDADDAFIGKPYLESNWDAYWVSINYGDLDLKHARFFRNGWKVKFSGAVHEVPDIYYCRTKKMSGVHIEHSTESKPERIERNISILESEHKNNPSDKRTLFYLGNAYREAGKLNKAIKKYQTYIDIGGNFRDELVLAHYYLAICYYRKQNWWKAIKLSFKTLSLDDRWAEIYCCIGECYYNLKQYKKAIPYFSIAKDLDYPKTNMWVRKEMYNAVPDKYLSICYEALGAKKKSYTRNQDVDPKLVIEVIRAGALGDIIATTPALSELRKEYPEAHIRYVAHSSGHPILQGNDDIDEIVEKVGISDKKLFFKYPMHEGYPYVPMSKHLAEHFADSIDVTLSPNWRCKLSVPKLSQELIQKLNIPIGYSIICFSVKTGWSRYKEWPIERWERLIRRFPDHCWVQLGAEGEPKIPGALYACGHTLTEAFSVLNYSDLYVGLDSVFNHACNALQVPAVIMFGSTHPKGSGYYEATNLYADLICGPCYKESNEISVHKKSPCPYDHKCMKQFMTIDLVEKAIRERLTQLEKIPYEQFYQQN